MIPPLDVFGPRVVGGIFRKVDDTLFIAMKLEFVLPNSQLSDELLHPNYFLVGFLYSHILGFHDHSATTFCSLDCHETAPPT